MASPAETLAVLVTLHSVLMMKMRRRREAWKVQELKRINRDSEDREALEKEKAETERM